MRKGKRCSQIHCFQPSTQVIDRHSTRGRYCCELYKHWGPWHMLLPLARMASAQAPQQVDVLLGKSEGAVADAAAAHQVDLSAGARALIHAAVLPIKP